MTPTAGPLPRCTRPDPSPDGLEPNLVLTLTLTLLQASCVSLDPYEAFGPVMWDVYK